MLFNQEPFIDLFKCKHWSIPGHWLPSATLIISILILVFFFRVAIKLWKKSLKVPKGGRQEEDDDLHLNLRLRCSKEISKRKRAELKTNQTIDNNYIQPDGEFVSSEGKLLICSLFGQMILTQAPAVHPAINYCLRRRDLEMRERAPCLSYTIWLTLRKIFVKLSSFSFVCDSTSLTDPCKLVSQSVSRLSHGIGYLDWRLQMLSLA